MHNFPVHRFRPSAHNSIGDRPKILMREGPFMTKDCTNGGCACTPNQSIKCTVNNCANHCQDTQYCGLTTIQVGTHEANPTMVECTDCQSFQMK